MTKQKKILLETLILPLVAGFINILFFKKDPGFFSVSYFPYLLIPLFIAATSGIVPGYIALGWEIFLLAAVMPWPAGVLSRGDLTPQNWITALKPALFFHLPIELILILIFGQSFSSGNRQKKEIRDRLSELSRENLQLKKLNHAQAEVSRELEERVYRQQEAITTLYARIQKMYTLDLDLALQNLLETIQLFSRAESLSFARISQDRLGIVTVKTLGESPDSLPVIPMESSLEGWVLRNNRFFSIRMVLEYEHLNRLDQGRSVLIFPLQVNRKPWGLISIHRMPFVKYNEYTEQLLEIIIHLAATALTRAAEYDALMTKEAADTETGILLYSQFLQVLDEEIIRLRLGKSSFSFVILEILNLEEETEQSTILPGILEISNVLTSGRGEIFHYKKPSQLAILLPSVDEDGASLFCLEILEKVGALTIGKTETPRSLDAVVGFAHSRREDTRESLMERAENILQAQLETGR